MVILIKPCTKSRILFINDHKMLAFSLDPYVHEAKLKGWASKQSKRPS